MMFMRFSYSKLLIILVKTIPVPYVAQEVTKDTSVAELCDLVTKDTPPCFEQKKSTRRAEKIVAPNCSETFKNNVFGEI